jgi:type IV secretion system protein VirB3
MSDAELHAEPPLRGDPLFLGMTRPALAWGVPFGAVVANATFTTLAFLASADLRAFALAVPMHALLYLVCLRDPRILELLWVRARQTPPVPNAAFWGAQSYRP